MDNHNKIRHELQSLINKYTFSNDERRMEYLKFDLIKVLRNEGLKFTISIKNDNIDVVIYNPPKIEKIELNFSVV